MTAGKPVPQSDDQAAIFGVRLIQFLGGIGDSLNTLGIWLNSPPDLPGVWTRIGVMSMLFLLAIFTTITGCIIIYWISAAVQFLFG